MNPNPSPDPREEIEVRITALLLGELSPDEAAALQAQIAGDAHLTALHARLRQAVGLLRAACAEPEHPVPEPQRLSEDRRERLLAHFKIPAPSPSAVIVKPRRDWRQYLPLSLAAAFAAFLGVGLLIPPSSQVDEAQVVDSRAELESKQTDELIANYKAAEPVRFGESQSPVPPSGKGKSGAWFVRSSAGRRSDNLEISAGAIDEALSPDTPSARKGKKSGNSPLYLPPTSEVAAWSGANTYTGGTTVTGGTLTVNGDIGGTGEVIRHGVASSSTTPPAAGPVAEATPENPVTFTTATRPAPVLEPWSDSLKRETDELSRFRGPADAKPAAREVAALREKDRAAVAENGKAPVAHEDIEGELTESSRLTLGASTTHAIAPARPEQADGEKWKELNTPALDGRVVFWTDDESVKVKINTASEGVYWDAPDKKPAPSAEIEGFINYGSPILAPQDRVPVLGDIPVVGALFSNHAKRDLPESGKLGDVGGLTKAGSGTLSLSSDARQDSDKDGINDGDARRGSDASAQPADPNGKQRERLATAGEEFPEKSRKGKEASGKNNEKAGELETGDRLFATVDEFDFKKPAEVGAKGVEISQSNRNELDFGWIAKPVAPAGQTKAAQPEKQLAEKLDSRSAAEGQPQELATLKNGKWSKLSITRGEELTKDKSEAVADDDREAGETDSGVIADGSKRQSEFQRMPEPAKPEVAKQLGAERQTLAKLEPVNELRALTSETEKLKQMSGKNEVEQQAKAVLNFDDVRDQERKEAPAKGGGGQQVVEQVKVLPALEKRLDDAKKLREEDAPAPPPAPALVPQPEVATSANVFSTFSLNVSDVAFKLAGASLEQGRMPDPGTVRSEEFINAFDYRDPEPAAGAPLAFVAERARYPFAQNRDLLRFSVKTAAAGRQPGRPLNLVLLLDNSGSMERADRVRILREALRVLSAQLQPQDRLSVVTFARTPRLWADGVAGDKAGEVTARVGEITPQGGTNLAAALDLGYATARKHFQPGGISRVVLLTDGAANLGDVNPDALRQKVEVNRQQGVALDCFGIGWEGYDDTLLEALARNGDGRYGFINTPEEAATGFAAQLAGALRVAASDVKVQVEWNPKRVTAYRQIGYAKHQLTKEQFRDNTVDAAEIGAAESGNALYAVEVNPRGEGDLATVRVRFKVPGTADYKEHEWTVPFTREASPLEQASPALRLAGTASAFAEWLAASPYAAEVTPDRLLGLLNGVPAIYGADPRPPKLEWMIRTAKSVSGR